MRNLMCVMMFCLAACSGTSDESELAGVGGGPPMVNNVPTVHMPFPVGTAWRCTQGAGGSYSHQYNSTNYDVDLDTPNAPNAATVLYAPVSGVIYVHDDGTGFGLHLNVDHGNGTYTILGHLSQSFVSSGTWVELGESVGLDGCSGSCSGDHVHLGVHSGDASRPAGEGTSIPFNVFATDTNTSSNAAAHSTGNMICGLTQGHFYESQLPVWSDNQEEVPDPVDDPDEEGDDDSVEDDVDNKEAGDDEPVTPAEEEEEEEEEEEVEPDKDELDEEEDNQETEPEDSGPGGMVELCWQTTGLVNPHDGELWVWYGGWQTVASATGDFNQLCGTVEADPGDLLVINGAFEAANVLSNPWWVCSNWGSAGGMVVHGTFYLNGIALPAVDVDNGVNGCNARIVVP